MNKAIIIFFLCLVFSIFLLWRTSMAEENRDLIHMTLKDGLVVIENNLPVNLNGASRSAGPML